MQFTIPPDQLAALIDNAPRLTVQRTFKALETIDSSSYRDLCEHTINRLRHDAGQQVLDALGIVQSTDFDGIAKVSIAGHLIGTEHLRHMLSSAYEAGAIAGLKVRMDEMSEACEA